MTRPLTLRLRLVIATLLLAGPCGAQEPIQYRVEVIVFEHTSPFAAGELFELGDSAFTDAATGPVDNAFTDTATATAADVVKVRPRIGTFTRLAADEFELDQMVQRLANASRFRVLGHFGWTQETSEPDEALAFAVSATDTDGRVNGTVTLSRSRFLRLDADLTFASGEVTVDMNQSRRRVQTGRAHYFDHPYFGVIIRVSR